MGKGLNLVLMLLCAAACGSVQGPRVDTLCMPVGTADALVRP